MFKKEKEKNNNDIKLVCLKTTNDVYELSTIKSLLEDNDIPFILHENGIGEYMRIAAGVSLDGTDIMINEEDLDRAKELIDGII